MDTRLAAGEECTVVVRFDFLSPALIGHQMICAPCRGVTEAQARAAAWTQNLFEFSLERTRPLAPPTAKDFFLFGQPAADIGGATIVSARTGAPVFAGGVVWAGSGRIVYPPSFHAPDLSACIGQDTLGGTHFQSSYALPEGGDLSRDTGAEAVRALLDRSPIYKILALSRAQVIHATLLFYPPRLGLFDPAKVVWIALIHLG